MRLALFHNLPSGGAKRALQGLAKYLARDGWELDLLVPSTADEQFLGLAGVVRDVRVVPVRTTLRGALRSTLRYLPPVPPLDVSLADLETAQATIAELIDEAKYDAVLVEQDRYTMTPFILRYLRRPTVYFCQQPNRLYEAVLARVSAQAPRAGWRGVVERAGRRYGAWKIDALDRRNAAAARFVLANSYFSREVILRAYGLDARVCYLGVDGELFTPRQREREDYVVSVGVLAPWKGYDFLVRALGRVARARRPPLVIVANGGSPPWRRYLERLAAEHDVRLTVRELVSDAELVDLYARARLLAYAPYLEPFGLVLLEAMACGTPVLAVREGGVREIVVEGVTGVLADRDEDAFADAVTALLDDERRRRAMAARARERVHQFWTLAHAAERLASHLRRAIERW